MAKVLVSALSSQDEESTNSDVGKDGESRRPPDERVADEVDLAMILDPAVVDSISASEVFVKGGDAQVDPALEERPRARSRVVGVTVRQAGVRLPHDGLELGELAKEARLAVVDLLRAVRDWKAVRHDSKKGEGKA